jgi:hypothetical protein
VRVILAPLSPVSDIAIRLLGAHLRRMPDALRIVATDVLYYHQADERAFFEWLDRMTFVGNYYGVVGDLIIEFNRLPSDDDLWEIIGFCRRYGINMAQLAKFETVRNSIWMRDPEKFWHAEIFGRDGPGNGS